MNDGDALSVPIAPPRVLTPKRAPNPLPELCRLLPDLSRYTANNDLLIKTEIRSLSFMTKCIHLTNTHLRYLQEDYRVFDVIQHHLERQDDFTAIVS